MDSRRGFVLFVKLGRVLWVRYPKRLVSGFEGGFGRLMLVGVAGCCIWGCCLLLSVISFAWYSFSILSAKVTFIRRRKKEFNKKLESYSHRDGTQYNILAQIKIMKA